MQTDGVQDSFDDEIEPESGAHLREEVRQSLTNALDMVSMTGDFWNGWPVIAIRAPLQLGGARFMAAVAGIAAHVESLAAPRWSVAACNKTAREEFIAHVVLSPTGLIPPGIDDTVDFLGGLGIRPED
jgi:hypothetical protein